MPYHIEGNCVKKDDGETVPGGCHKNHEDAVSHLQALEANVKDASLVEMSLRITKASYQKSDRAPMKWAAIDSDVDPDLFEEKMSTELYMDFCSRIENKTPIPEAFHEVICESDWCGGMPYLSIAHYKAGTSMGNVPGAVDSVYMDGTRLKSKGTLHDSPMGRKVFDALREDLYMEKSGNVDHRPVRISIGFLDLEHEHVPQVSGGQHFTFTRTDTGQICPLCSQGIGGKIYKKGQLIHLAMTRVPVNPRTRMSVEKSMDDIITKRDDAKSIIGELAEELEEKSIASDVLVVRSDAPDPSPSPISQCYDPNTGGWNNDCIASVFDKFMADVRNEIGTTVKSLVDGVEKSTEEKMTEATDKSVMGIPEKPFEYAGLDGNGNNTIANPVKAEAKDEEAGEKDTKGDEEKKEMSTLDKSFADLKSILANAKSVEEVQAAFNALGQEVEKSYTPPAPAADDLAAIVRSAVEAAVAPLKMEIATLKATKNDTVSTGGVVKSKALNMTNGYTNDPAVLLQKAIPAAERPVRQLSQIERLARKSTGLQG